MAETKLAAHEPGAPPTRGLTSHSIVMQQSASQLFYRLLDGQADLQPLRILGTREFAWLGWTVSINILGASHAVALRHGETCVTELLTCVFQEQALTPLIGMQGNTVSEGCVSAHGLLARVNLTPFCLDDGDALKSTFPEDSRFEITFPGGAGLMAPVTRVGWHVAGPTMKIETVHSYPEENQGVRSVSLFVLERLR